MPRVGDVFDDVRDNGRTMRISCHEDHGTVVVSLWQTALCRGSFRLAADDLGRFISVLTEMTTLLASDVTPADTPGGSAADPGGPVPEGAAPGGPERVHGPAGTADLGRPPAPPILRTA